MKRKLSIGSFLIFVIVFGYLFTNYQVKKQIEKKLTEAETLDFQQMELSLWRGNLVFKNAHFNYPLTNGQKILECRAPEIIIGDFKWSDYMLSDKIHIGKIKMASPQFFIEDNENIDTLITATQKDSSDNIPAITIENIELENGQITINQNWENGSPQFVVKNLNFKIDKFESQKNGQQFGNIECLAKEITMMPKNGLHQIYLAEISANQADSVIEIGQLKVAPVYDRQTFFKQIEYKKARLNFLFPEIKVVGFDFNGIWDRKLIARKIDLLDFDLAVLTNKNIPIKPGRYKPLPQEALAEAPFVIAVDSIFANKGRLLYEMIGEGKTKSGAIEFIPVKGVFVNVTNDSSSIAADPLMEIDVTASINGDAQISNQFWMDLSSPDHAFTFRGNLSQMPFASLNSFLKACADVHFKEGLINSLSFEVNANRYTANGSMQIGRAHV